MLGNPRRPEGRLHIFTFCAAGPAPELPRADLGLTQRMQYENPLVTAHVLLKA